MEVNFDKEMDALLRQTARYEKPAPLAESHLDADELAAFSANALPVNARARAMEHLVDCGNCRTILSNLVFFEDREEEKPAGAIAASSVVKQASLAERILGFFKFPALAYGMAGLVLVFTAGITLMVFRGNLGGPEVAQLSKKDMPAAAKSIPEQYSEPLGEAASSANSNMAAANSTGSPSIANRGSWGGAYTPPSSESAFSAAANSSSNMALGVPATEEDRVNDDATKNKSESAGGSIKVAEPKAAAAPPQPAPVVTTRQLQDLAKPQNNTDQIKGQDNYRSNNNILTPDGVDKDRGRTVQRAVQAEAGANAPREAARDEKENQAATSVDVTTTGPVKTESKKAAGKKPKKKSNVNAESDSKPAATPTPSPAKKKPDEEDRR